MEKVFWKPILKIGGNNNYNKRFIFPKDSQVDVLRLYQALAFEVWETRFLLSCLPIIKKGIRLIKTVYFYFLDLS